MLIKDFLGINNIDVEILDTVHLPDCEWHKSCHVYKDEVIEFAILEYSDGYIYSQIDWQADVVMSNEIADVEWVDSTPHQQ